MIIILNADDAVLMANIAKKKKKNEKQHQDCQEKWYHKMIEVCPKKRM